VGKERGNEPKRPAAVGRCTPMKYADFSGAFFAVFHTSFALLLNSGHKICCCKASCKADITLHRVKDFLGFNYTLAQVKNT
jgi:hypothetical protein